MAVAEPVYEAVALALPASKVPKALTKLPMLTETAVAWSLKVIAEPKTPWGAVAEAAPE